jgi:NAD(P)-dependent dehydrogenase (short-subunit alcohol dehydrogenase family)
MGEKFKGRVAVVTGASSGIGAAIARALGAEGASLALLGRDAGRLEGTARDASGSSGARVRTYVVEFADSEQVRAAGEKVELDFADLGGVDIVVHSAGVFSEAKLEEGTGEGFEQQWRVNLLAPYELTRSLAGSLKRRGGEVVFINSSVARGAGAARAGLSQYASMKLGLKGVADAVRAELNESGVRVLSVYVGRTATPMQREIFKREGKEYRPERLLQPEDVASVVVGCLSLPRTAEVTEVDVRPRVPERLKA